MKSLPALALRGFLNQGFQAPHLFAQYALRTRLRPYQRAALDAISFSVEYRLGLSFVVIFPRQSGKNETQLCLYSYLLLHEMARGGDIIHVEPTFKPQTEIAMLRLERKLAGCGLTRRLWYRQFGHIYGVGQARVVHFSGEPGANVVGATAGLLLSVNEAQDILPSKFDKDFAPMAASTNATRVFWGTRWTDDTLLEREYRAALDAQAADGLRRVFFVTAEEVGRELETYRRFVQAEIGRLGRQHPLVRTQYFCETLEAAAGMFPPERIALLRGAHPRQETPTRGRTYAFCIDVGGQDERSLDPTRLDNPARDSTCLTIAEIEPGGLAAGGRPLYRVVQRRSWLGEKHTTVFAQLLALNELWGPQRIVIDATGVGEGLWSLLDTALPGRVSPLKFSEAEKSALGYGLIQIIETGRLREYDPLDPELLEQMRQCASQVRPGPARSLRWGVPDGKRDAAGNFLHDDLLLSLALLAVLDRADWHAPLPAVSAEGFDPLAGG